MKAMRPQSRQNPLRAPALPVPTDAGEGPRTARESPFTEEEPERRGFWSRLFGT